MGTAELRARRARCDEVMHEANASVDASHLLGAARAAEHFARENARDRYDSACSCTCERIESSRVITCRVSSEVRDWAMQIRRFHRLTVT